MRGYFFLFCFHPALLSQCTCISVLSMEENNSLPHSCHPRPGVHGFSCFLCTFVLLTNLEVSLGSVSYYIYLLESNLEVHIPLWIAVTWKFCLCFPWWFSALAFVWTRVLRSRHLINPASWADTSHGPVDCVSHLLVGQPSPPIIPVCLSFSTQPLSQAVCASYSHCLETLTLFSLPNSNSPSSLNSVVMSSTKLLMFATSRNPGQVKWGQVRPGISHHTSAYHWLHLTYYAEGIWLIHLSPPSGYTFFKDLDPSFTPLDIPNAPMELINKCWNKLALLSRV